MKEKQNRIKGESKLFRRVINCHSNNKLLLPCLLACLRQISLHKNEPFPHVFRADAFSFYSLLTVADLWEFEKNPNFHFVKIIQKGQ